MRYADLRPDVGRAGARRPGGPHRARAAGASIVAVPLDGGAPVVLASGPDFMAALARHRTGALLAWLEWDHPDMPWDATRLRVAPFGPDGTLGASELAAADPMNRSSSPSGRPPECFISRRTGPAGGTCTASSMGRRSRRSPRCPPSSPIRPGSSGGRRTGSPPRARSWRCAEGGRDHLFHIRPGRLIGEVVSPFTEFEGLVVRPHEIVAVVGSPSEPSVVARFDPMTLAPAGVLRRSAVAVADPEAIAVPEAIEFPVGASRRIAHALYYAPRNPDFRGPHGRPAATRRQEPRRAYLQRLVGSRSHQPALDQPGDRRRGRRLRRQQRVWPSLPARARRAVGDRRRR